MRKEHKLTEMHLKILGTIQQITSERQLASIDSLLNFYFRKELEDSIKKVEFGNGYTEETYEEWLKEASK